MKPVLCPKIYSIMPPIQFAHSFFMLCLVSLKQRQLVSPLLWASCGIQVAPDPCGAAAAANCSDKPGSNLREEQAWDCHAYLAKSGQGSLYPTADEKLISPTADQHSQKWQEVTNTDRNQAMLFLMFLCLRFLQN